MVAPKGKAATWLSDLIDKHGEEVVDDALVAAAGANPDHSKLLGNTQGLIEQRAFRAKQAAESRQKSFAIREMEDAKARAENSTPEERAKQDEYRAQINASLSGNSKGMS